MNEDFPQELKVITTEKRIKIIQNKWKCKTLLH